MPIRYGVGVLTELRVLLVIEPTRISFDLLTVCVVSYVIELISKDILGNLIASLESFKLA